MLLGLSGSLRRASLNRKLLREAARLYGGDYVEGDLDVPLYNGDVEDEVGLPDGVQVLADQILGAEAVIISTPEYNQSLSGVMKNALDWVSRHQGKPWADKPVALLSAAAGRSGGARGNYALRLAMTPFRPRLLTREVLVAGASKEFDEQGRLTSDIYLKDLGDMMDALKGMARQT